MSALSINQVARLRNYPRLVAMVRKFILAEKAFTKDTGIELDDQIADTVKEAELLLKEIGE